MICETTNRAIYIQQYKRSSFQINHMNEHSHFECAKQQQQNKYIQVYELVLCAYSKVICKQQK